MATAQGIDLDDLDADDLGDLSDDDLQQALERELEKPMIVRVLTSRQIDDLKTLTHIPRRMVLPLTNLVTIIEARRQLAIEYARGADLESARHQMRERSALETWYYNLLLHLKGIEGQFLRLLSDSLVDSSHDEESGKDIPAER